MPLAQKTQITFALMFALTVAPSTPTDAKRPGRGLLARRPAPAVPDTADFHFTNPLIAKHGKIVRLPQAEHQPRSGSKIVVDVTRGGKPGELNAAIEKVARYINIYAGAGKQRATARIAVVLHGDATLTILNDQAYSKKFGTKGNPNLDCLRQIHEAGAEIYVCGQSLVGKGSKPKDVVDFSKVAVSALTALVNLQTDGCAYIPLGK